ncbi:MAG: hypothetical protein HRT68_02395 [Flavobacteriaceae bacterium]|nr:hypothetical protein [Flavobacteriaceae bacterium]
MTLQEATTFIKSLVNTTERKHEKKIYSDFAHMLNSLQKRDLTPEQLSSIEEKLTSLDLKANPEKRKRHIAKKFLELKTFIEKEFSWVTEKHYAQKWMVLGMSFGMSFGIAFGAAFNPSIGIGIGISLGLSLGIAFGMALGAQKDAAAKKKGRVL